MTAGLREFAGKVFYHFDIYWLAANVFWAILYLIIARLLYWFLDKALKKVIIKRAGGTFLLQERRAKTLYPLLRSILFYAISFFLLISILRLFGVSTTALLGSATVLGLAVGFGAQSLVKDTFAGFFVLFEDQYAVGEYVKTDKYEGIVEEIGLRATKLRDWGGELHIIPNGTITSVTNFNRGKMRAMVDINLPYDEDIEKAMELIGVVGREVSSEFKEKIVEGPTVQGIINLGESFVVVRILAYTEPMQQWEIERELRRRIVKALAREGIRVPNLRKVYVESRSPEGGKNDQV